jgi:hypothetical protein
MLTEVEAQDLMLKLIDLRKKAENSEDANVILELKKHENLCIEIGRAHV